MDGLFLPLLLLLVVAIPLVMGTRKQKRMMAQQQELQNSLAPGDRVMTTSGMYATVADASDDTTIDLEIADGVVTTWLRQAVREKINPVVEDDAADDATDDEDDVTVAEADVKESEAAKGPQVAPPLEHEKK
ncbi:preprotein translocase subunit YajC [Saccharomonospora sp. NPDC046836]|uniref:preprotein translocase subunit YajC n=1 Tax=Saccharomonospora sp. NPDC046836 TaxID=3156921 RepID=UPI003401A2C7